MFAATTISPAACLATPTATDRCDVDAIAREGNGSPCALDPVERLNAALKARNVILSRAVVRGHTSKRTNARVSELTQHCLELAPAATEAMGVPQSSMTRWVALGLSNDAYAALLRRSCRACESAELAERTARQLWRFASLLSMYEDDGEACPH